MALGAALSSPDFAPADLELESACAGASACSQLLSQSRHPVKPRKPGLVVRTHYVLAGCVGIGCAGW